jgi:hypothetical protein
MYPHVLCRGDLHVKMTPVATPGELGNPRKIIGEPIAGGARARPERRAASKPRRATHPGNIGSYGASTPVSKFK